MEIRVPTAWCELREGFNLYRVQVVRMKEHDAGPVIEECEKKQKEERLGREVLGQEGMARVQAILYALSIKFLTSEELMEVRWGIEMTISGEMIRQDGIEEGMEKGIQALAEFCRELGVPSGEIILKLIEKFALTKEEEVHLRLPAATGHMLWPH